jgi:hypothetical protein
MSRPCILKVYCKYQTSWDEQSSLRLRQLALSSFLVIPAIAILIKGHIWSSFFIHGLNVVNPSGWCLLHWIPNNAYHLHFILLKVCLWSHELQLKIWVWSYKWMLRYQTKLKCAPIKVVFHGRSSSFSAFVNFALVM